MSNPLLVVIQLRTVTTHNWKALARILTAFTIAGMTVWYTVASVLHNVHPLDAANLGLIAIAVICIVLLAYPQTFSRIHAIEVLGVKVDLLETRQKQQQMQLKEFELILPILLPPTERKHILNLACGETKTYVGNNNLRTELRRLRSVGLIKSTQTIGSIRDGVEFDLANVVQHEQEVRAEGDGRQSQLLFGKCR